jgi:hypothetical protein
MLSSISVTLSSFSEGLSVWWSGRIQLSEKMVEGNERDL